MRHNCDAMPKRKRSDKTSKKWQALNIAFQHYNKIDGLSDRKRMKVYDSYDKYNQTHPPSWSIGTPFDHSYTELEDAILLPSQMRANILDHWLNPSKYASNPYTFEQKKWRFDNALEKAKLHKANYNWRKEYDAFEDLEDILEDTN